jgi:hypothetical protein
MLGELNNVPLDKSTIKYYQYHHAQQNEVAVYALTLVVLVHAGANIPHH